MRLTTILCCLALSIIAAKAIAQESEPSTVEAPGDPTTELYDVSATNSVLDSFGATGSKGKGGASGKGGGTGSVGKSVADAYQVAFYANDFSYLTNPSYNGWHLGENLKRLQVGDHWIVDFGGQYRMRVQSEQNINNAPGAVVANNLGLTGDDDDFLLHRTRLYANAEYGKHFRFYGEMVDALSELGSGAPRPIEENRTDVLNLFGEVRNIAVGSGTIDARVGRQEIALGAQRLVSPLDWGNTRRTFEGARVIWHGEKWDVDGFWLRPMKRDGAHRSKLDAPNLDRQMYGMYANYKGLCHSNLDVYWIALDYEDVGPSGFRYDTIGSRYWGGHDAWLYELEGGVQFGENADGSDHSAGFATAGVGRKLPGLMFSPVVWLWYDWASGDDTVGNGFHHYEPLVHKYNGFMDIFGRRNLNDVNVQAIATLTDKTKLLLWYHYFSLANGNDVPYNVTMTPFAGLTGGSSGSKDLGHEIDCVVTQAVTPRSSILFGYSHFFAGKYYATTPGVPYNGDATFFYTQWHVNF